MKLTTHIPPCITIAGYRTLTSYEGQPQTCYGCGDTEHMYHTCPKCRRDKKPNRNPNWNHLGADSRCQNQLHQKQHTKYSEQRKSPKPRHNRWTLITMNMWPQHDTFTHQINNEVDKTKIQDPSKTTETAPDSPTPLQWAHEPFWMFLISEYLEKNKQGWT